jgi:N-acetylglucosaminyl-diphospho-decaprenol L-rhamnosyltransferase
MGTGQVADLGLVLVHYRTPQLAVTAVELLLEVAREDDVTLELVLVDNGSCEQGQAILRELAHRTGARLLETGRNLGFAGAANLGLSTLSTSLVGVMNPDVLVAPGCLRELTLGLSGDAEIVGPRFYWDQGRRLLLPPAQQRGRLLELLFTLGRTPTLAGLARRQWRRHARRHWRARESLRSFALVGALLLFRRSAYQSIGPFDEGYALYFEETDWLARAREAGKRAMYLPGACAVHLFDQSAQGEPRSRTWFAESTLRYRRRHYGNAWTALLARVEGPGSHERFDLPPPWPRTLPARTSEDLWIEVSPSPYGYPAAAEFWAGPLSEWCLPEEIRDQHPNLSLYVRVVDSRGRERGWYRMPALSEDGSGA